MCVVLLELSLPAQGLACLLERLYLAVLTQTGNPADKTTVKVNVKTKAKTKTETKTKTKTKTETETDTDRDTSGRASRMTPMPKMMQVASVTPTPPDRRANDSSKATIGVIVFIIILAVIILVWRVVWYQRYRRHVSRQTDDEELLSRTTQAMARRDDDENEAETAAVLDGFDAASVVTDSLCAVCLDKMDVTQGDVLAAPCCHVLHEKCWRGWLAKDIKRACPICRACVIVQDVVVDVDVDATGDGGDGDGDGSQSIGVGSGLGSDGAATVLTTTSATGGAAAAATVAEGTGSSVGEDRPLPVPQPTGASSRAQSRLGVLLTRRLRRGGRQGRDGARAQSALSAAAQQKQQQRAEGSGVAGVRTPAAAVSLRPPRSSSSSSSLPLPIGATTRHLSLMTAAGPPTMVFHQQRQRQQLQHHSGDSRHLSLMSDALDDDDVTSGVVSLVRVTDGPSSNSSADVAVRLRSRLTAASNAINLLGDGGK